VEVFSMVSMRLVRATVVAAVMFAVSTGEPASVAAPVSGSARAATGQMTVDLTEPESLPIGAPPRVAYLDYPGGNSPIYRPGDDPLPTAHRGVQHLMRVHGGYVVIVLDHLVRFVGDDGERSGLVRVGSPEFIQDVTASRDGRFVAVTVRNVDKAEERLIVRRVSDKQLRAQRTFTRPVYVATFTRHRALLTTGLYRDATPLPHLVTQWWNLRTGELRRIDDAGRPGSGFDRQASPGDLTAGQVALVRDDHDRVVTLPGRPGQAWRTRSHEWVQSWAPDDRYVLTMAGRTNYAGWNALKIRRAGSGALVTTFQGLHNLYVDGRWAPVWESSSAFVFFAGYGCDHGDCGSRVVVRCTVHGQCEQVAAPAGITVEERQIPAS
jgi:hypothetical protein